MREEVNIIDRVVTRFLKKEKIKKKDKEVKNVNSINTVFQEERTI